MSVHFAVAGPSVRQGDWRSCVAWALTQAGPVQILRARPGEPHARVIAESASHEVRLIRGGRTVPVSKLRRGAAA